MKKLEERNLFVDNNSLIFKYRYLFAKIVPIQVDGNISFYLNIYDVVNQKDFRLFFATLEGAIDFVINVVSKSMHLENVISRYKDSITSNADHQMCLSEANIFFAINNYYCNGQRHKITAHKELSIENGNPKVLFYIIENLNLGARGVEVKLYLSEKDLKKAINSTYLKDSDYEVSELQFVGGIHYAIDSSSKDKPFFEGFKVYTKDKEKEDNTTLSMKQ